MINDHLIFVMGISSLSAAILGTAPHNTPEMQGKFPESLKVWLFSWRNMAVLGCPMWHRWVGRWKDNHKPR